MTLQDGDAEGHARYAKARARILADDDGGHDGVVGLLHRLCRDLTSVLGVTGAAVNLMSAAGSDGVAAASDDRSRELDELQFTTGEGPCLDAFAASRPVLAPDLRDMAESHWPGYASAALAAGVSAVFAFPIHIGGVGFGVLDVYSEAPGSLRSEQVATALTYAQVATEIMLSGALTTPDGQLDLACPRHSTTRGVGPDAGARLRRRPTSASLGPRHHRRLQDAVGGIGCEQKGSGAKMISNERLANAFVEVADTLVDEFDLIDFLHILADHASDVTGATSVGLMLVDRNHSLQHMAASTDGARHLELFQLQHEEGPCLDCFRTGEPVILPDLSEANGRWPVFAPRAVAAAIHSVHAFPMRLRDQVIGALNLFGEVPLPFEPDDIKLVQAMADIATIGILQERAIANAELVTEQLQGALISRVAIEQAKGMISRDHGIDVDDAFTAIRRHARENQLRLVDVAHDVVTGKLRFPPVIPLP